MQVNFNLLDIQRSLNYTFKNAELIKTAFVHRSYEKANAENSSKLVFLGEKLIALLIADYIYTHSTSKGDKSLNADYEAYLNAIAPVKFIKKNALSKFVLISNLNEPLRDSELFCKELFYAITAAIYKDGGLPALKGFLMPMLRAVSSDEHYEPSIEGKIESRADALLSSEKHISNAKLRIGAKPSAISVSKAQTVNEPALKEPAKEKTKKESSLAKILKKKEKESKPTSEAPIQEEIKQEAPPIQKRFIRDPFAPVKLSDDLRNFKPKKQQKAYESKTESLSAVPEKDTKKEHISEPMTFDDNHKSLLQETIQKNIRTASVLIKYDSKPIAKNEWVSNVFLSDEIIGVGKGENKKSAEKAAASAAYSAIKNAGTKENKFFVSLCTTDSADTAQSVDYISKINQYFQKTKHMSSAPITYEKRHSGQKNMYMLAVIYEGKEIAAGKGASLKEAKQNAAKVACEILMIK